MDFFNDLITSYLEKNEEINNKAGIILNEVIFDNTRFDFRKIENILKYILLNDFKINLYKKENDIIEIVDKDEEIIFINYYDFIKSIEALYYNFDSLISNVFEIFDTKNSNVALKKHREKQKRINPPAKDEDSE